MIVDLNAGGDLVAAPKPPVKPLPVLSFAEMEMRPSETPKMAVSASNRDSWFSFYNGGNVGIPLGEKITLILHRTPFAAIKQPFKKGSPPKFVSFAPLNSGGEYLLMEDDETIGTLAEVINLQSERKAKDPSTEGVIDRFLLALLIRQDGAQFFVRINATAIKAGIVKALNLASPYDLMIEQNTHYSVQFDGEFTSCSKQSKPNSKFVAPLFTYNPLGSNVIADFDEKTNELLANYLVKAN